MLELINLSHQWQRGRRSAPPIPALDGVNFTVPGGHLAAVLGAVGSGKTSLIRLLVGLEKVQAGAILWRGVDVTAKGLAPRDRALVAGEEGVHDYLNVKEHVISALMLRVPGLSSRDAVLRADRLLVLCGLDGIGGKRGGSLDLAQKRRLSMAVALAADPKLVVCDDFTAGVDPKSERELGALMQTVAKAEPGRIVLNATHALAELGNYNSVLVLHEGRICFHGPGRALTHYFSIPHTEDLFHKLAMRPSDRWRDSWNRHSDSYYAAFDLQGSDQGSAAVLGSADDGETEHPAVLPKSKKGGDTAKAESASLEGASPLPLPSLGNQISVLLRRNWTMVRRARWDSLGKLATLLGTPLVFALLASPAVAGIRPLFASAALDDAGAVRSGAVLSMVFFLQTLAILFAAVVCSAGLFSQVLPGLTADRVSGLRLRAWTTSLGVFAALLVLANAVILVVGSELVLGTLPGAGAVRAGLLIVGALAFGSLCLGTSALSRSVDQSFSRCWMLAFVNAILCGAVLAWPGALGVLVHPFLTANAIWSAAVETIKNTPSYAGIEAVNRSWLVSPGLAFGILAVHFGVGVAMLIIGARWRR